MNEIDTNEAHDIAAPQESRVSDEGNLPVVRQLLVALGILGFVFITSYTGTIFALMDTEDIADDVRVEATLSESTEQGTLLSRYFNDVSITARAAFVWDIKSERVLFNKNADEELPLASITKLMTALVAHDLLDSDASVNISVDAIRESGDSGLRDGETFSVRNLSDLVLVESSNDGARALSSAAGSALVETRDPNAVFVEAMNIKAEELGLTKTRFSNVTGLDISETEAGAYGTAREVAFLMKHIGSKYPSIVELTATDLTTIDNVDGEYHLVKNTNEVVNDIPGIIASKTGYTRLAGGNLVIAFDAGLNRPIIVVVLGSSYDGRFADTILLSEKARGYAMASK